MNELTSNILVVFDAFKMARGGEGGEGDQGYRVSLSGFYITEWILLAKLFPFHYITSPRETDIKNL
jgi:hypothetical protein